MKVAVRRTVLNEERPILAGFTIANRAEGEVLGFDLDPQKAQNRIVKWDTGVTASIEPKEWALLEVIG